MKKNKGANLVISIICEGGYFWEGAVLGGVLCIPHVHLSTLWMQIIYVSFHVTT